MFKVKRTSNNRLDVEMSGKLNSEEMKKALDDLIDESEGIENGKMLYDVVDYRLPSLGGVGIELYRLPSMLRSI